MLRGDPPRHLAPRPAITCALHPPPRPPPVRLASPRRASQARTDPAVDDEGGGAEPRRPRRACVCEGRAKACAHLPLLLLPGRVEEQVSVPVLLRLHVVIGLLVVVIHGCCGSLCPTLSRPSRRAARCPRPRGRSARAGGGARSNVSARCNVSASAALSTAGAGRTAPPPPGARSRASHWPGLAAELAAPTDSVSLIAPSARPSRYLAAAIGGMRPISPAPGPPAPPGTSPAAASEGGRAGARRGRNLAGP